MRLSGCRFGRVEVDGVPWREDFWICAGKIGCWWRKEGHRVHPQDLTEILALLPETVITGTKAFGMEELTTATREFLAPKGIEAIALPTKHTLERYNELA